MSRRALSPPSSPASPMTVPDSPAAPHELDDMTPLERRSMPVPVADAAPRALRGDVTPEFDVPAVAACPICLLAPSSEPEAEDTAFPCCNAFTHLTCLVRCAHAHGTCPNCRAAIDHLPREPGIVARCQALGINMHPADAPASDTAFAVVRDYSVRTFSRADAAEPPEPPEPVLIRAVCCNRLAGPAFDFAELPDARMHWAPLPRRGTDGIETWLLQWICMRCRNELPFENVRMPSPTPTCPMCHTPILWEVDVARQQERWVCSRCPHAHAARPFAPTRHAAGLSNPQAGAPHAIGDGHSAAPAPALALTQYTTIGPPPLPLRDGTNSALYVPLLLDAAGVLTPHAQLAWRSRAPFSEWWPAAVDALRARPFIPVDELTSALQHVALAFAPAVLQSPSVQRFWTWAHARAGQVASLSEVVRQIAAAPEGHYIAELPAQKPKPELRGPPHSSTWGSCQPQHGPSSRNLSRRVPPTLFKSSVTPRTDPKLFTPLPTLCSSCSGRRNSARSPCIRSSHPCAPREEARPLDPQASLTLAHLARRRSRLHTLAPRCRAACAC